MKKPSPQKIQQPSSGANDSHRNEVTSLEDEDEGSDFCSSVETDSHDNYEDQELVDHNNNDNNKKNQKSQQQQNQHAASIAANNNKKWVPAKQQQTKLGSGGNTSSGSAAAAKGKGKASVSPHREAGGVNGRGTSSITVVGGGHPTHNHHHHHAAASSPLNSIKNSSSNIVRILLMTIIIFLVVSICSEIMKLSDGTSSSQRRGTAATTVGAINGGSGIGKIKASLSSAQTSENKNSNDNNGGGSDNDEEGRQLTDDVVDESDLSGGTTVKRKKHIPKKKKPSNDYSSGEGPNAPNNKDGGAGGGAPPSPISSSSSPSSSFPSPLDIINKYSRTELLSAMQPFRDITLLPSVFTNYKELVKTSIIKDFFFSSSSSSSSSSSDINAAERAKLSSLLEKSAFPQNALPIMPWVQITNNKMVEERGVKVGQLYSCYGRSRGGSGSGGDKAAEYDDASSPSTSPLLDGGFDFAFFPVGCFGDPIPRSNLSPEDAAASSSGASVVNCSLSRSPSCHLGKLMNKMAMCGAKTFGAFLGDNFYPNGIVKWGDRRIEEEIPEKFTKFSELGGSTAQWFATVGNHDVKPKYQFRGGADNSHWIMPDVRHASPLMVSSSSTKTSVQLFLFSTQWGYQKNDPFMEAEARWLDAQLTASTADWKIVGTHEQIFGFMGFDHGVGLIKHIHPILIKHKVRLFVCAHQHSIQSFLTNGNYYHVTSAGFAEANIHHSAKPRRPPGYYHADRGALAILLSKHVAHVVAFDEKENIVFAHMVHREVGKGLGKSSSSSSDGEDTAPIDHDGKRLLELKAHGIDPRDPMWRAVSTSSPNPRKCDRFKLKDSFVNGSYWDKSDEECWMYG